MKDIQVQTPQGDQAIAARRSKSTSDPNKNPRKVLKKKLSPAFKAVSEDDSAVFESLKEFPEVSDDNPFVESAEVLQKKMIPAFKALPEDESAVLESLDDFPVVSNDNPFVESAENFIALMSPLDTPSSEKVDVSDLTSPTLSSFSVITSDDRVIVNATDTEFKIHEADFLDEIKSIETEVVIKHLREARIQVLKSKDVGSSKKILDALINIVIEEYNGGVFGLEERKGAKKFLPKNANMIFLSFMMGVYAVLMLWFFSSDAKGFNTTGPTPT
ncbi:hypothetical protein OROMI_032653 [Orobanche minor]